MSRVRMSQGTVDAVVDRDEGRCRKCGRPGQELHHRRGRGAGGTKIDTHGLARLVLLCGDHHRWAESHRAEAYATGWAVRRSDPRPDCEIPLVLPGGAELWLYDDGTATVC